MEIGFQNKISQEIEAIKSKKETSKRTQMKFKQILTLTKAEKIKIFMQIYMQILIDWTLMYQSDGGSGQRFLRFYAFCNVTKLFGVFLNAKLGFNKKEMKNKIKKCHEA